MNNIVTCVDTGNHQNLSLYKQYEVKNDFDNSIWLVDDNGDVYLFHKKLFIKSKDFDFLKEDTEYLYIKLPKKILTEKYKYCSIDADGIMFHTKQGHTINYCGKNIIVNVEEFKSLKIFEGINKITPITVLLDNNLRKDYLFDELKKGNISSNEYIDEMEKLKS